MRKFELYPGDTAVVNMIRRIFNPDKNSACSTIDG